MPEPTHESRRGITAGITAYVLWGFLTVYWKQLEGYNAFELIGQRIIWSVLVLAIVATATRQVRAIVAALRTPAILGRVVLAAALLAVNWTTYVWAVTHGEVIQTALGYFIAPLLTVAIGVVVLGEHLRRAQQVALALGALAVIVLGVEYGRVPILALMLGLSWSSYGYLKKTVPLVALPGLAAETVVLLPAALVLVAIRIANGSTMLDHASAGKIVLIVGTGVITTIPLLLFAWAARRIPLSTIGPLQYAVPTINFLLGVFAYHEKLTSGRLAGFAIVWVALAILASDGVRAASAQRAAVVAARA